MKRFYKKWAVVLLGLTIAFITCFGTVCASSQNAAPEKSASATIKPSAPLIPIEPILEPIPEPVDMEPDYTEEELEILALIIYQEAGGDACLDSTRQMVGEVFLNRVESSKYPNTFYEVATQRSQYGRLHWTGIEWPERADLPQEQHAIERAYGVAKDLLTESADRFLPVDAIYQAEFEQGSEILICQDGLYFCR
jgi:hypothetical protein